MRQIILWIIVTSINIGQISGQESSRKIFPDQFESSIVEDKTTRNVKRTVRVEINQPISERRIRTMARTIKGDGNRVERMWVFFQFPNPISSGGAWATVTFEGDKLESVSFNGPTRQQIIDAYRFEDDPDRDIRQIWISFANPGERIVFFVDDDLFYLERRYLSNLSSSATTVNRITASRLPLKSWGRFMSEEDKDYNEFLGFDRHWLVDDDNILKRMDGDKVSYAAYPVIPGESHFPNVKTKQVSVDDLCKQDLQCWGDKHAVRASLPCTRAIENALDGVVVYEWTDSWLTSKFTNFIWKPGMKEQGIITYFGTKLKVQNVDGGWLPSRYECDYDPSTDEAIGARVK